MALGDRLRALKKPVAATPINIPTNPSFEYSDLLSPLQWNQPEEEATAENPIRGNLRGQFGDAAIQDIIDEADSSKTGL